MPQEPFVGWRDLRQSLSASPLGVGSPTLTAFGPTGNIKQMKFAIGDSVYVNFHVDHDVRVGSQMYPHVHWTTDGTSTNTVKWQLSYTIAKGHQQESFPTETVITVEQAAGGVAWRHMIAEHLTGFVAPEVDSLVIMEVKRISNGGTDNSDIVFGLFSDLHYEADRVGTLNKAPNFYGVRA